MRGSKAITQLPQVGLDGGIQSAGFGHLLAQRGGEPLHLLLERLAVVLLRLGTDVASGREHVAMLADPLQRGAVAEAGNVLVRARVLLAAPGMVGAGDAGDLLVRQLAVRAIYQPAELAGVD